MVLLTAKSFVRLLNCKSILLNAMCFDELGCHSGIEEEEEKADGCFEENRIFDSEKTMMNKFDSSCG